MVRPRSVLLLLALLAGSLSPPGLEAQSPPESLQPLETERGFVLEQNYPNPVNPETWIPFYLGPTLFSPEGEVLVTIRILNVLNRSIALPDAIDHPRGQGTRVFNLPYSESGRYVAYWDGKDEVGRPVPSGVYYIQMVVRDEPQTRKLIVLNERRRRRFFPW